MDPEDELAAWMAEGKRLCQAARYAEARRIFEKGIHLAEATWGQEASELISPLMWLAIAVDERRPHEHPDCPRVLTLEERALRIAETALGRGHPRTASVLENMGLTLSTLKMWEEARHATARALEIIERVNGETGRTGHLLGALVWILLEMKRPAEALPMCYRIVRIEERNGENSVGVRTGLCQLGRCLLDLGRGTDALPHLERALALVISNRSPEAKGDNAISRELRDWFAEAHAKA